MYPRIPWDLVADPMGSNTLREQLVKSKSTSTPQQSGTFPAVRWLKQGT